MSRFLGERYHTGKKPLEGGCTSNPLCVCGVDDGLEIKNSI